MAATLAGFGLMFAPRETTDPIEAAIHDAALPGLRVLDRAQSWVITLPDTFDRWSNKIIAESEPTSEPDAGQWQATIDQLEAQVRSLQAQNAQLIDDLETARAQSGSPFVAEAGTPLFVPELLDARVVAVDDVSVAIQRASAQRVVDVGQTDGVVPADFVVSGDADARQPPRLLIDQGDDVGLNADQPVFAGRCVIGKIQQVGRWTSSILPVTDAEYRGRAQLLRRTEEGLVVGPEGIIAGAGEEGCHLNFIAATQPVAVGDEVYTAVEGTPLPVPMYYGRVTRANLPPGAPYWEIRVAPVENMAKSKSVQVLRTVLNPSRTSSSLPQEVAR